jgi:hypothetical protein
VQPRRTGKPKNQEIKCPELYGSARCANASACVLGKDASGQTNQAFTVSNKIGYHARNALTSWFLSNFAIELIAIAALAVLR